MKRIVLALSMLLLFGLGLGCDNDQSAISKSDSMSAGEPPSRDSGKPRPNVILITVDTLRADALGAYGQPRFTSPNIDRLAREGVVFLRAMASAPSTLSSHASIMTGKHPYAHGARSNAGFVLSEENETIAEALGRNGYRTGAEIAASVLGHGTLMNQGFDLYRDLGWSDIHKKSISVRLADGSAGTADVDERAAGDITDFGIEFLQETQGEPFFLWLHYFDPHMLYAAPAAYDNLIPDSPYHAEVRYVDTEIGRLLRNLESLGLGDRTLVVLTSDHGEALGEHGEATHSYYVFESTMHVPLIVWGAKSMTQGRRVESLVRSIDIGPTILDLLDLPRLENAQGRSLVPLMTGEVADLELIGYGESMELRSAFGSSILRAVRRGDWKYIHKLRPALFDLSRDPHELDDLASRHPDKVGELAEALRESVRNSPAPPRSAQVAIDDETLQQLRALGYAGAESSADLAGEKSLLDPHAPDPSDLVDDVRAYSEGWSFMVSMQYDKAVEVFERLVQRYPSTPIPLVSLGDALVRLGRYADAVPILQRAIRADARQMRAYNMLARSEQALGHLEEAESAARAGLELQPCSEEARVRLAQLVGAGGRAEEQLEILRDGAERCPDGFEVLNYYAYLLSTAADAQSRDGAEAIRVAKLAVEKSGGKRADILDTLASAHAENGDFGNAVRFSRRAVDLAVAQGKSAALVDALKTNLDLFSRRQPARSPAAAGH